MKGSHSKRIRTLAGLYIPLLKALTHPQRTEDLLQILDSIGYTPELPHIQLTTPSKIASLAYLHERGSTVQKLRKAGHKIPPGAKPDPELRTVFNRAVQIYEYLRVINGRRLVDPNSLPEDFNLDAWLEDVRRLDDIGIALISGLLIENKDHVRIPMSSLSSGEQSIFFRFIRLFEAVSDDSVVLIDEPEIHLHPKWIQSYIPMLISLFKDRSAHIILATHSPLIVANLPRECVVVLKKDGRRVYQSNDEYEPTLGADMEAILEDIFGLTQANGLQAQKIISMIRARMTTNLPDALSLYRDLADSAEKYKLFREMKALSAEEPK